MLNTKYIVGLILAATLIVTLMPFSAVVYAKNQKDQRAEKFIEMAEQAKQRVDELMDIVEENQGISPDITDLYNEGVSKLEAAVNEQDTELAKEAMTLFRKVYKQLYTLLEGEEAEAEVETEAENVEETEDVEDSETLMEAIERARERIGRVEDIIEANAAYLTDDAEDVLDDLLDEAKDLLDEAEHLLEEGDVSAAAKNLGRARRLISRDIVSLRKAAKVLNRGRVKSFLIVISNFYDKIARWVERGGLPEDFEDELGDIQGLIDDAKDMEIDFEDIVSNLMEARIRLESIKREILERKKGGP
jgi:flagellin-specific chaperone FliS